MAFRIHESVVRGEIDNRVKGVVRGKIWLEGRATPLVLELKGNAWPDLAGCLLTFTNPQKRIPLPHNDPLHSTQEGTIGDLTASRKVRVFDVPLKEALEMYDRKEKPPEHMANCLYLEWYSQANGRVVVESPDYELTISTPEWRMTPDDEADRARQAAEGMVGFFGRLTQAIEQQQRNQKDPSEEWDEHDYEKFMKECDARTDKYGELLDKYGDSEEADAKIAKEMGWDEGEAVSEEDRFSIEEINAACEAAVNEPPTEPDPHREGIDWIRTEDGDLKHPLQHRCFESSVKLARRVREMGLKEPKDRDLAQLIFEFHATGAKLAGALNSLARGQAFPEAAFTVAYLKRALDHLHKAQAALETTATKGLLPVDIIAETRRELFEIREGILRLMEDFRGRK